MSSTAIEVYCDAGISPASMPDAISSVLGAAPVGRIVVLIPAQDYGFVQQVKEGILNKKGNPSSNLVEILAVNKAQEICTRKRLTNCVIYTDNQSAASAAGVPDAKWLEPGRLQLASLFLQRIVSRASYLRRSSRKVISRSSPSEVQKDEFRLFNTESLEFALSKSPLWKKIQSDITAARGVGQERLT